METTVSQRGRCEDRLRTGPPRVRNKSHLCRLRILRYFGFDPISGSSQLSEAGVFSGGAKQVDLNGRGLN